MNYWSDTEYLFDFFENNSEDLKRISIAEAINVVLDQVFDFEDELLTAIEDYSKGNDWLDKFFVPLGKVYYNDEIYLFRRKAHGPSQWPTNWLRIYAIKLLDCYVITGGAIKLTQRMEDREHNKNELEKFSKVIGFLKEQGIYDKNAIIDEIDK